MCQRVSKLTKEKIREDLKYMGDIELGIRDWQDLELSNSQIMEVSLARMFNSLIFDYRT